MLLLMIKKDLMAIGIGDNLQYYGSVPLLKQSFWFEFEQIKEMDKVLTKKLKLMRMMVFRGHW